MRTPTRALDTISNSGKCLQYDEFCISIDVDDGKTTVVIVQQPATTDADKTDDAATGGEGDQTAADVQLTTTVDDQVEDVTGLPGVVKSVFGVSQS